MTKTPRIMSLPSAASHEHWARRRHIRLNTAAGCAVVAFLFFSSPQVCSACESWEFRCANGDCVRGSARCDAVPQCNDASDEISCPVMTPTGAIQWTPIPCGSGQFQCTNGRCIYPGWRCDGQDDCHDMSDERSCPSNESSPMMSMGSIVGLSIAVAGLLIVVIGIAIMMTCIRRKNMLNAREVARQSRSMYDRDCYMFSVSGHMLDREPPPRYASEPDLTLIPPALLQQHLQAALSMEPPPYYSSQPDLSSSMPTNYCSHGHLLEAPPCYTSHVNLSVNAPPGAACEQMVHTADEQLPPVAGLQYGITGQGALQSSFGSSHAGSLDRRRRCRGSWSNKHAGLSPKRSPCKRKSGDIKEEEPGKTLEPQRGKPRGCIKEETVDIEDRELIRYSPGDGSPCRTCGSPPNRRRQALPYSASTPALVHTGNASQGDINAHLPLSRQLEDGGDGPMGADVHTENCELFRPAVDFRNRRFKRSSSVEMLATPGNAKVGGTLSQSRSATVLYLDTESYTAAADDHSTHQEGPQSCSSLPRHVPLNPIRKQQRLSQSMSILTDLRALQRHDSFTSTTSCDC